MLPIQIKDEHVTSVVRLGSPEQITGLPEVHRGDWPFAPSASQNLPHDGSVAAKPHGWSYKTEKYRDDTIKNCGRDRSRSPVRRGGGHSSHLAHELPAKPTFRPAPREAVAHRKPARNNAPFDDSQVLTSIEFSVRDDGKTEAERRAAYEAAYAERNATLPARHHRTVIRTPTPGGHLVPLSVGHWGQPAAGSNNSWSGLDARRLSAIACNNVSDRIVPGMTFHSQLARDAMRIPLNFQSNLQRQVVAAEHQYRARLAQYNSKKTSLFVEANLTRINALIVTAISNNPDQIPQEVRRRMFMSPDGMLFYEWSLLDLATYAIVKASNPQPKDKNFHWPARIHMALTEARLPERTDLQALLPPLAVHVQRPNYEQFAGNASSPADILAFFARFGWCKTHILNDGSGLDWPPIWAYFERSAKKAAARLAVQKAARASGNPSQYYAAEYAVADDPEDFMPDHEEIVRSMVVKSKRAKNREAGLPGWQGRNGGKS